MTRKRAGGAEIEPVEPEFLALARACSARAAAGRPRSARGPASRRSRRGYRSKRCRAPARCRSRPRPPRRAPSPSDERADAHDLAAPQVNASHGSDQRAGRARRRREGFRSRPARRRTTCRTSSASTAKRRADIGHFERAGAGRVADQRIGRAQAHRIERAAHRNAEMLIAGPAEILDRGQQAGREDAQRRRSCRRSHACVRRARCSSVPSAALASRSSYSRSDTGANVTCVAGREQRRRPPGRRLHSGTGDRPMRCQPHGRLQRKDAGHRHGDGERAGRDLQPRRLAPRQASSAGTRPVGLPRQEAEHIDVIDRAVPLDDLSGRETGARRDLVEIGRETRRSRPAGATGGPPARSSQTLHQFVDARDERTGRAAPAGRSAPSASGTSARSRRCPRAAPRRGAAPAPEPRR